MKLPVCQCAKSTKCGNSFKANFIVRFYEFYIASHSLSTVMLAVAGTCATRRTQWSSSLQPAVTSLFGLGNVSLVRHQRPVGNGLNLAEWFSLLPLWALDKAKTPGSPSFGRPAKNMPAEVMARPANSCNLRLVLRCLRWSYMSLTCP